MEDLIAHCAEQIEDMQEPEDLLDCLLVQSDLPPLAAVGGYTVPSMVAAVRALAQHYNVPVALAHTIIGAAMHEIAMNNDQRHLYVVYTEQTSEHDNLVVQAAFVTHNPLLASAYVVMREPELQNNEESWNLTDIWYVRIKPDTTYAHGMHTLPAEPVLRDEVQHVIEQEGLSLEEVMEAVGEEPDFVASLDIERDNDGGMGSTDVIYRIGNTVYPGAQFRVYGTLNRDYLDHEGLVNAPDVEL